MKKIEYKNRGHESVVFPQEVGRTATRSGVSEVGKFGHVAVWISG